MSYKTVIIDYAPKTKSMSSADCIKQKRTEYFTKHFKMQKIKRRSAGFPAERLFMYGYTGYISNTAYYTFKYQYLLFLYLRYIP